ncbi:MAG TPA: glycosyltransferase family 9 protein, partial [Candidatus Hydrogenedentes bacterium]|nr:glycosyltransferase family 9 protein [Candidatus Hydrogenedentota bacterium]
MADPIQKILVLVPNWLGDAAMSTPALRALHKRFAAAHITVAGRASACALLAGLPWLHGFVALPARPNLLKLVQLGRRLRPHSRDLAVVLPHGFRAALLARLSGAARRLGYDRDRRALLLTDAVPPHREHGAIRPIYMAKEYLDLVRRLGCEDDGEGLELRAAPEAVAAARAHLGDGGPVVGIAAGAAFGPSKRWPAEYYARL